MTVDSKAIADMANIMAVLNGQTAVETAQDDVLAESAIPTVAKPVSMSDPSIDAMKSILTKLQAVAEGTTGEPRDQRLVEALRTEPTERGARIGSWEIVKNPGETATYDVVSEDGHTVIARDLYLYEAALGLVRRLNEGMAINDKPIRDLMLLEENYVRARNDAVGYKQRAKKMHALGESKRAEVAEDRFDRAQTEALAAHDEILRLAGLK